MIWYVFGETYESAGIGKAGLECITKSQKDPRRTRFVDKKQARMKPRNQKI